MKAKDQAEKDAAAAEKVRIAAEKTDAARRDAETAKTTAISELVRTHRAKIVEILFSF